MKATATAIAALFIATPCSAGESKDAKVIRLSEPVEVTAEYEVFGSSVGEIDGVRRLADVVSNESDYLGKEVFVEARVARVCQKKGCWFMAHDGDAVARITFVDYSFFVPTDSSGKEVTIVGTFDRATLSEEKARHFAEDAGADPSKIVGPQPEFSIVARAVVIPKG